MAHFFSRILGAALLVTTGAGCGDDGGSDSNGASGSGGSGGSSGGSGGLMSSSCGSTDDPFVVLANEANNFTFTSSLDLDVQTVAPNAVLDFDWSGLSADFQGHALNAIDVDSVVLIVWNITPAEIAQKINEDAQDISSYVQVTVQFETGNAVTSATLTDFTAFGADVPEETLLEYLDPALNDPATHSYTLMAQEGSQLGVGVHMIQAFQIDTAATATTVTMTNDSTVLDWQADLSMLTPTVVPAADPGILINWSQIETRSYGGEFIPNQITEVLIGSYSLPVTEIEQDFLNLELIADDLWRGEVPSGVSFNLANLTHAETGEPFPGVTGTQAWILGLLCNRCTNPTPWYITTVETCP